MEETLGKRIVNNRKRLGMTQDALAELLGVTAQAVSKWENDQSCPDITMLPKLADIFGITTDTLLGLGQQQAVREAELVPTDNEDEEKEGIPIQNGNWEFKYDSSRKNGIALAIWVLLAGGLLLTSNLLHLGAGFWDILWPSGLLIFGLIGLYPRFSFFRLGCGFFGAYFLLSNLNIAPFEMGKELLLPILLVLFGLSLLADALRKDRNPTFQIVHNGKNLTGDGKHQSFFTVEGESFTSSASFTEKEDYIQMSRLSRGEASVSFGELTVDLRGCEEIAQPCKINASCSFGELKLLIPGKWRVETSSHTAFASVEVSGHPDSNPQGVIYIDCSANFGEIQLQYV